MSFVAAFQQCRAGGYEKTRKVSRAHNTIVCYNILSPTSKQHRPWRNGNDTSHKPEGAHGTYAFSISLSISLSLDHQYLVSFCHTVCFPLIAPPSGAPVYTLINGSFSHVVADARLSMPSRARRTLARRRTRRRWASTRFSRPAVHSQHHLSNRQ